MDELNDEDPNVSDPEDELPENENIRLLGSRQDQRQCLPRYQIRPQYQGCDRRDTIHQPKKIYLDETSRLCMRSNDIVQRYNDDQETDPTKSPTFACVQCLFFIERRGMGTNIVRCPSFVDHIGRDFKRIPIWGNLNGNFMKAFTRKCLTFFERNENGIKNDNFQYPEMTFTLTDLDTFRIRDITNIAQPLYTISMHNGERRLCLGRKRMKSIIVYELLMLIWEIGGEPPDPPEPEALAIMTPCTIQCVPSSKRPVVTKENHGRCTYELYLDRKSKEVSRVKASVWTLLLCLLYKIQAVYNRLNEDEHCHILNYINDNAAP